MTLRNRVLLFLGLATGAVCSIAGGSVTNEVKLSPETASRKSMPLSEETAIQPDDLRADLDFWLETIRTTNPDLATRVSLAELERKAATLRRSLDRPMTQREAWSRFALLNPVLNDGHNGVFLPQYRSALELHVAQHDRAFPMEVRISARNDLVASSAAIGVPAGSIVETINGVPAKVIVKAMLDRTPGDTDLARRAWASRRFAALHWLLFGEAGEYRISIQATGNRPRYVTLPGTNKLPTALQSQPLAEAMFSFRVLDGQIGYLRLDSFDEEFAPAMERNSLQAFTAFKTSGVRAIIVDLRENGGGADAPWQTSVMNRITSKPYAQLSRYSIRVTQENADPGDVIGSIQTSAYTRKHLPPAVEPARFDGPVYILVGPYTYSSAIQFAVAAQDFGLATIAGEPTGGFSCQTGQVRAFTLKATGLVVSVPLISYVRPSGRGCNRGVMPDLKIAGELANPEATIAKLAAKILRTHGRRSK